MRIDAHQHFWQYSAREYSWMNKSMETLKRDFMPENLYPIIKKLGIHGTIAVQARQSLEETQWLLDLRSKDLPQQLEQLKNFPKFVGVRHVIQDEPDDEFMLRSDFLAGIQELYHFDLTFDILIYPKHLDAALKFVERFPDHKFVLDHSGKPSIRDRILYPWKEQIHQLAKFPHVYCKLSGMVTEADWHNWKDTDFHPYLDSVFECFGTDRLLMGSDWPVCTLAGTYYQVYDIILDYIKALSNENHENILGKNAMRFYKISEH